MVNTDRLEQLGFKTASTILKKEATIREKLTTAYEHYRYLTPEKLAAFNEKLKRETEKTSGKNQWGDIKEFKRTKLTSLGDYPKVPPGEVLDALQAAQDRGCFDAFEIMTIESHKEVPDPILFGKINDCPDLFMVAQWDDDIKIEDMLKDHEGWKFLEK